MSGDVIMDQNDSGTLPQTHNQLEQFTLLAKTVKGAARLELIKQVLEAPGVYVFGELLVMENIIDLANSPNSEYLNTLNLFAYGTYKDYSKEKNKFIELTSGMKKKLQHLTIVSMAVRTKCIPYNDLLEELEISNVRDLEDLIIEAIYADIIHGKLDQKNKQLEIDSALGRDTQLIDISKICETLGEWCQSCETILFCIEEQIKRADAEKARRINHKEQIEEEVLNYYRIFNLKKSGNDQDEVMNEPRESTSGQECRKKSSEIKTVRPSGSNVKTKR